MVTTDGCTIFPPIHGSKSDTPKTIAQVPQHYARGIGACGWRALISIETDTCDRVIRMDAELRKGLR